ncbi:MAG: two-component sensor histidine kinase [Cytophagales bacterium]|nr:two-component sensor histidine kinase [Cytophagales bacterium]
MLFNSRSVAFLFATVVSLSTALGVSITDSSLKVFILVFLLSFLSAFSVAFVILEFLIFKEIRKIYKIFNRFRGEEFAENKDAHAPIQQVSQDLSAFVHMKEREINKLKELESFRREFLADLSHELKTPVFAAQGFIHTLLDGAVDDERVRGRFLSKAAKSLDDLDNLVQDLIAISQLETGEVRMRMEAFNIVELIDEVFEQLMLKAEKRGVSMVLENRIRKVDVLVHADKNRIKQVLKNLVDNAIKYGNENGVVTVHISLKKEAIQLIISDDGPGISEEHQSRIFQRFYRIEKSRSKEMGGTGLGLAIVKHIIEAHESNIILSSKEGKGTSFTFKLLKAEEEKEENEEISI